MQHFRTTASISGVATRMAAAKPGQEDACLANTSFKVVEGRSYGGQLPLASFRTDDKGRFYLELPVGVYSVVEDERPETFKPKQNTKSVIWDNDCLKLLWRRPLLVIDVKTTESMAIRLEAGAQREEDCLQTNAHGK